MLATHMHTHNHPPTHSQITLEHDTTKYVIMIIFDALTLTLAHTKRART